MLHVEAFAFFERHIWVYNDINKHMKQTCFLFHRHFKLYCCKAVLHLSGNSAIKVYCQQIVNSRGLAIGVSTMSPQTFVELHK